MECAVVDCKEPWVLDAVFSEKFRIVIFCVAEDLKARQEVSRLPDSEITTPGRGQIKFFEVVRGDMHIGYTCGRFASQKVTFFTDRTDFHVDDRMLTVVPLEELRQTARTTPGGPPDNTAFLSELLLCIVLNTARCCLNHLLRDPKPMRKDALLNSLRNWATGAMDKKQYRALKITPSSDEIASKVFQMLSQSGVFFEERQEVRFEVPDIDASMVEKWVRDHHQNRQQS